VVGAPRTPAAPALAQGAAEPGGPSGSDLPEMPAVDLEHAGDARHTRG
jgi:hypothetical protein